MKLSIIIPAYNAEPYIDKLIERLEPQITKNVEVIVVDDGSKKPYKGPKWVKVIRQENGGASAARNTGLDHAKGDYIAFIDADDLVTEDYIQQVFDKLNEGCDYIYLSWQTTGSGWQAKVILQRPEDKFPPDNLCVWNRIYRRDMIGDTRFNTKKKVAEDAEFLRLVETDEAKATRKRGFVSKPIYLYRSDTPNSLSKRFAGGALDTKRIIYYFRHVTADMDLLPEVIEADKEAEVIIMTNKNDQPELTKYAMVIPPRQIMGTEARGEKTNLIRILEPPTKTQIVIWTSYAAEIGGIETFTYSFCQQLSKYYDIICLYDNMSGKQIERVSRYCECRKNDPKRPIECEFLVVNRIVDDIPPNIIAKKTIQMVHGAKISYADVPQDRDQIVTVSQYVKDTWKDRTLDATVIHNVLSDDKPKDKPLLMVTASRLDAQDKGLHRMIKLGHLMDEQKIPYVWLVFTNIDLPRNTPRNMVRMQPTMEMLPWIQKADYLVQLSAEEAFCYSLAEALTLGTPVIVTPLGINDELGIQDKKNAYVVPFEIPDDFDTKVFQKILKFKWPYDNAAVVEQWREIFGNMKPTHSYKPEGMVSVKLLRDVTDSQNGGRLIHEGTVIKVTQARADKIIGAGYGKRV